MNKININWIYFTNTLTGDKKVTNFDTHDEEYFVFLTEETSTVT